MGTAEAQAEVSSLLTELQSILEPGTGPPPGGKLENFLTAMARARSLRAGTEASSYLDQRAPRWQEHKDVVLQVGIYCIECTVQDTPCECCISARTTH